MSQHQKMLLQDILKEQGYSCTKTRYAVFNLLVHPEPQSMAELLKKAGKSLDRVTIYRTIDLFEKLGIVQKIYIGWKYKLELSDQFMPHHHHLTCLGCGLIIDIEDETHIDEFIGQVASRYGFTPKSHQFEVSGYCTECARQLN